MFRKADALVRFALKIRISQNLRRTRKCAIPCRGRRPRRPAAHIPHNETTTVGKIIFPYKILLLLIVITDGNSVLVGLPSRDAVGDVPYKMKHKFSATDGNSVLVGLPSRDAWALVPYKINRKFLRQTGILFLSGVPPHKSPTTKQPP